METSKLRKQIDENTIVKTLVEVHNIRKISQAQMMDIFTLEPNRIAPIAERVHIFLQKISYLITMSKLQVQCEDKKFVDKHPQEYQAMQAYFADDGMNSNQFGVDIVDLCCIYESIGKFCISTEKFHKEIQGTPGDTKEEVLKYILQHLTEELEEHEKTKLPTARYAYRFFRKLLEKNKGYLPEGVKVSEVMMYIKGHIYDDELNR